MAKEVGPNVICRVIGGNSGPKSPNIGRIVKVLNRHPNPAPHTVWDDIWECVGHDGKGGFPIKRDKAEEYGTGAAMQTIACFPTEWLQPLDDDPPKQETRVKETELTD